MLSSCQLFSLTIFLIFIALVDAESGLYKGSNWVNHGGDLHNRRYASKETKVSPKTVHNLRLKWRFDAEKDITATPAIYKGKLYFPSWDGYLYALEASNGSLIWKKNLQNLTGYNDTGHTFNVNTTVARTTPAIAGDLLIVGLLGPAVVVAVNRENGELVWTRKISDHPYAVITMSGTCYKGGFYIGVSSKEEDIATPETCCTFIGSFVKLDAKTGKILWQKYMLPNNQGKLGGYSGGAIWGSSPSIDIHRNHVYIATGNLYSAPDRIIKCQERENNQTRPTGPDQCIEPDNHSNSILALDLDSGSFKWYKQLGGYDVWFYACNNLSTPNCPPGPNPDADFGEAPLLFSVFNKGVKKDVVAAVQKSGFTWALDRDNGHLIWSTEAGPGGLGGGGTWGAATDGERVYTNIANSEAKNFTLKPSNKTTTTSGGWVAMDGRTGSVLWSTANPSNATANGPVSVANGIVFGGSTNGLGPIYAMDARNGEILWSYETGATVFGGMSISDGCVYVGNGYKVSYGFLIPSYTAGKSLFSFCIP